MKRKAIEELYRWKARTDRKPLIVQGARQVGKTWLMKEFAKEAYQKCAYVNFEDNDMLRQLFQNDFDIPRIINSIQWTTGVTIDADTLIILDEIQEAPRGITALKYFQEKAPEYHVVAAGSLLGIAMHQNDSFPVGKVDFMYLYPLSFFEFLEAIGEQRMVDLLLSKDWQMITMFRTKFEERLRQYYYVGGMPAVVSAFAEGGDIEHVRNLQNGILESYERDFSKHAPAIEVPRIRMVWQSVPAQLSKENRKFVYGVVKEGARAKDFELAIEWLKDAGLIYKVNRSKKGQLPLAAYEDFSAFKIFMSDIGLMGAMSKLPAQSLLSGNALFSDFKGALTEQYVMQQLKTNSNLAIYYWSADSSRGEIDFLLQRDCDIIPVEVKAEENLQAKSLRSFVEKNPGLHGVRLSMSPYREQDWMTNYPLYSVLVVL
ncbi:ATP-binding protein [Prevotella sp.]|uniref:ATP-binding protein n=1 Tax=uncultured Prevotella sp. TaxID=159272 RepID=UPI0025E0C85E|nr:ATP-binding protein [Prevotella sp.]MCI7120078.1 ATP-binding protein [Prevotella sp.]